MFKELNPLLHSELRLAVMSILLGVEEADFVFIREQTGASAGNLSVQIDKLQKAGYITGKNAPHALPHYPDRRGCFRGVRRSVEELHKNVGRKTDSRLRRRQRPVRNGA